MADLLCEALTFFKLFYTLDTIICADLYFQLYSLTKFNRNIAYKIAYNILYMNHIMQIIKMYNNISNLDSNLI